MKSGSISLLLGATLLTQGFSASAEFIGINIGASYWSPALDGSVSSDGDSRINLRDDLGLDDSRQSAVGFSIEHPISVLPNLKYEGFTLDSSSRKTIDSGIDFNGTNFGSGSTIESTVDLSHEDIVLYYEVMDNWINLDLGVDLKRFDGEVTLSGSSTSRLDIDEVIPSVYFSARYDLPFTGFYLGADLNNLSLGDSSVEDTTLKLGYQSNFGLGVEGGLKRFSVELDDLNSLNTDLEYDGLYLNSFFQF